MDKTIKKRFSFLFAIGILSFVACSKNNEGVLTLFERFEHISPCDSLNLSNYGINDPFGVLKYRDCLVIGKGMSGNKLDIITKDSVIRCFKHGRGPGEVLMTSGIQKIGESLFLYDISNMRLWNLDIVESVASGHQVATIFKQYSGPTDDIKKLNRPFHTLVTPDKKVVASGIFSNDCWYGYLEDDCSISCGVDYVRTPSIATLSEKHLAALHTSNTMAISLDGSRMVSALKGISALSVSRLDNGTVKEEVRRVFSEPKVSATSNKNLPALVWAPGSETGFCALACNEERIFALYSGRTRDSDIPTSECQWLLVMDWNAAPVKAYRLERTINSICLDGYRIIGVSMHPAPMLYEFRIDRSYI